MSVAGSTESVELFTHPTCSGCQEALAALSELSRSGQVSLEVCSLGTASGRIRAEALGVTTVPTVRRGDDLVVLLGKDDLAALIDELGAPAGGARGKGRGGPGS
ncbi:MAG: hypothetical protein M0Z42_13140 [Actinomycetota bacterium]|jgi:glutaredoxin|nr:hypothetical protein [Actinomycetota bacterium]